MDYAPYRNREKTSVKERIDHKLTNIKLYN